MTKALAIATTGTNPQKDSIIAVATADLNGGATTYFQTPTVIPASAQKVHHISANMLRWGADPSHIIGTITNIINEANQAGTPLVTFNAPWTWDFIQTAFNKYNTPLVLPAAGIVDPLYIDHYLRPKAQGRRTLASLASDSGAPAPSGHPQGNAHTASCLFSIQDALLQQNPPQQPLSTLCAEIYNQAEEEYRANAAALGNPLRAFISYPIAS